MKKTIISEISMNNLIKGFLSHIRRIKNRRNLSTEFYEKIFSNVVEGSLVVSVDNIPGFYEIDVRSHLLQRILTTNEYELKISDIIKSEIDPGKDAINVGANIGLFSNFIAQLINPDNRVLAIEPTPNALKFLTANTTRNNNLEKTILFNGVATDKIGNYKINIISGKEEYSSLGDIIHPAVKDEIFESIEVIGDTIDNLVEKFNLKPGIIVIDVEGSEYQVLKGAINTIQKFKPLIVSEIDDLLLSKRNSSSVQVIGFLESYGYNIRNAENEEISSPFSGNIICS
jgi:FkbM family methyltransferase